ncbi:hypothetical protein BSPWISOX_2259 [uncultured Gammaproteobacteria bacterium]|nr:hypothetical protein BSPWISOX_2259 [uncultured Gammaproteobacteria bacterium]
MIFFQMKSRFPAHHNLNNQQLKHGTYRAAKAFKTSTS